MMRRFSGIIKENRGSLIVESMVATTLVVVGILGIMSLLSRSSKLSHYASHSFQATYLAAEGIEVVKNILDTDIARGLLWGESIKGASPFCVYYNTAGDLNSASCPGAEGIAFDLSAGFFLGPVTEGLLRREVVITQLGGEAYGVASTVSWKEGDEEKLVKIEDTFYPWRTQ